MPGVQRHRRDDPHPHHQRADPAGCRGRPADQVGRAGRGRAARRAVGRPVRDRTCQAGQGVWPRRRRSHCHRSCQLPRVGTGHNAFGADAGGQGRCAGAEGHVRRSHPAGARTRGARSAPAATATCSSPSRWRCRRTWKAKRKRRWRPTRKPSGPAGLTRAPDGQVRDVRQAFNDEARTFLISVAAELAGMHAQTLRTYDRLGLVSPQRSSGGGRRYSQHDVDSASRGAAAVPGRGRQPRGYQAHHRADQPGPGASGAARRDWPTSWRNCAPGSAATSPWCRRARPSWCGSLERLGGDVKQSKGFR